MNLNKALGVLTVIFLALGLYAWFGIIDKPDPKVQKLKRMLPSQLSEKLKSFSVTAGDLEITLEKRGDFWWVIAPHEYLANQEYIEKGLQIMSQSTAEVQFHLGEDRYGLDPGRAFLHFRFGDGENKRLVVGDRSGPADTIYVMDHDERYVYVVHNVWAQFLLYPQQRFYHPYLPIPGRSVKSVELLEKGQRVWKVMPAGATTIRLEMGGQSATIEKAKGLWFFKKMREFELSNLEFKKEKNFQTHWELVVQTGKGNIIFEFDEKAEKIYGINPNVFAEVDPYSLKSLGYELEKVIKSDKK